MSSVVAWCSCLQNQGAVTPNGELNSQQGGDPHPWVGHLHGELLQMIQDSHSHRSSRLPWKFEQLFHGHRTEPHRRVRESFGNSSTLTGCSCLDWLHMSTLQWCCNSVHVTVDLHCSSIGAHNPVVARGAATGLPLVRPSQRVGLTYWIFKCPDQFHLLLVSTPQKGSVVSLADRWKRDRS